MYVCPMFNGLMITFTGFSDSANRYTLNLASATSVMYSPIGDLVSSRGVCIVPSTNNIAEYPGVIGFFMESLTNDAREIRVYLELELFVQQLNRVYTIQNPLLLHTFQRVRLLEKSFEQVMCQLILRHLIVVADSLANSILDWYISHN